MIFSLETEKHFIEFWCTAYLMDILVKRLMFLMCFLLCSIGPVQPAYVDYSDWVNTPKWN